MTDVATPTAVESKAEEEIKLAQDVVVSDAGPCRKHVKVTVQRKAIDDRFNEKFTDILKSNDSHLNGFRPGKAPRKIVERRFKPQVAEQVRMEVLMASLEQIASDNAISPLSPPELDPSKIVIPEAGDFTYEFDVEVRPEFELPSYKGLKLKRPAKVFNDADIQKEKKTFLAQFGTLEDKPEGAAAEMDDLIEADVVVTHEGKELNKLEAIRVKVEQTLALPDGVAEGFGRKFTGAKVGEKRSVDIKISEHAANPDLRGKSVQAEFDIKGLKVIKQPELTEQLLGAFNVRSPEQMDEFIASMLERRLEFKQRESAREQMFEMVAPTTNWDLPQDLLARQSKRILARRIMEMKNAGMTDDQIMARQRLMTQDVLQSTAKALKEHFVLQKIADIEKIEIEEADIDDEIEKIADRNGESARKVRARLEREDLIEALATELLERKALDLVLQNAEYEDVEWKEDEADKVSVMGGQAIPGEIEQVEETAEAAAAANKEAAAKEASTKE